MQGIIFNHCTKQLGLWLILLLLCPVTVWGKDCRSLLMRNGGKSTNVKYTQQTRSIVEDIGFIFPFLKAKLSVNVVKSPKLLAETDGNFCVAVSEGLIAEFNRSSKNKQLTRGMLLFVIGHEIGHSILGHKSSCSEVGYKISQKMEMSADAFGGFLIYALDESYDAPAKVFSLLRRNKAKRMTCHGDPEIRDALLLKNLGTIKYNASIYRNAMNKVVTGSIHDIESGIRAIKKVEKNFAKAGVANLGVFQFAIATAYHRLWLMDKNQPEVLIGQPSLYFPKTIVSRDYALPKSFQKKANRNVKIIPGNITYYKKAQKHYETYLRKFPGDVYAAMNVNLLYMYNPSKSKKFHEYLSEFQAFRVNTSQYMNNVGLMLLYDSIRNGGKHLDEAEYFLKHAYQKSHWESHDLFLQSRIIFNMAVLYREKGKKDKQREFTSLYLAHRGGDQSWGSLITGKTNRQKKAYYLPIQIAGVGNYKLGMSKKDALRRIRKERLGTQKKEYYGYLQVRAFRNSKPVYKFWFRKNELIKMTLYPASGQRIEGVMCGDSKKSIPEAFGVPVVQGNRLLFPGSNVTFKTEFQDNEIVIAQIEMRKFD
ncbi:MAG: hypothetical protein AAF518_27080 [Spirochaetota bacterium]